MLQSQPVVLMSQLLAMKHTKFSNLVSMSKLSWSGTESSPVITNSPSKKRDIFQYFDICSARFLQLCHGA